MALQPEDPCLFTPFANPAPHPQLSPPGMLFLPSIIHPLCERTQVTTQEKDALSR